MKLLYTPLAALAACVLSTPASAQDYVSTGPLTYFCDETGFVRSDQTGYQLRAPDGVTPIPCPETVLGGQTGTMSVQVPGQPVVLVVVKSYADYRGWGLDSPQWRNYWSITGNGIYYSRYQRERGYNAGYRDAIRDTRRSYRRPAYDGRSGAVRNRYREQYGTWGEQGRRSDRSRYRNGTDRYRQVAQGGHVRRHDRSDRDYRRDYRGNDDRREFATIERRVERNRGNDIRTFERREFRQPRQSSSRPYNWNDSYRGRAPRQERSRPPRQRHQRNR